MLVTHAQAWGGLDLSHARHRHPGDRQRGNGGARARRRGKRKFVVVAPPQRQFERFAPRQALQGGIKWQRPTPEGCPQPTRRALQNMAQIARQPVRKINRSVHKLVLRKFGQAQTECDARLGPVESALRSPPWRRVAPGALFAQRQGRPAERSRNPNVIARLRPIAPQGGRRIDFAKDGDGNGQRATGRIASHQLKAKTIGQCMQPAGETTQPDLVNPRQGNRQQIGQGSRPHCCQIRQVDRERLMAKRLRVDFRDEMRPLDKHIGRDGEPRSGDAGGQQGAVIANPQFGPLRPPRPHKVPRDEVKLAHGGVRSDAGLPPTYPARH